MSNVVNVLEWLEASAGRAPEAVAVSGPEESLSFADLLHRARAMGSWLAGEPGAAPRRAVALYAEKGPRVLAAMLGAVYAGDFYSVIDVRQPASRIHAICEALDPVVVLVDAEREEEACALLQGTPWNVVPLARAEAEAREDSDLLARIRVQALDIDPLYANFTSGSTGTPKGVVVSHRSVIDFIPVFDETFGIDGSDVIGNQAPFDFDVSVKDIYSALRVGARLQLVPRGYFTQPTVLLDYLAETGVTTLIWAVSAMCFVSIMNGFEYRVPADIRRVVFSGEVMPPKQLRAWQRALPATRFFNVYGPTEITCNCTFYEVRREFSDNEVIPMGRAFKNERVFLLDADDREVTVPGVEGEVCVSGTALALGYLGDDERTAKSFVQSPLNGRWRETVYRTGDLASYDESGDLVYATRKDFQIKHMGQRIELGDIEAAAHAVEGVSRACCVYDAERKRIHLFYVGAVDRDKLFDELKRRLPQYMVPGRIAGLDEMPLNKNGKIDRRALLALAVQRRRRAR